MDSIILFDGVCNMCNRTVQLIIAHDKQDRFKFSPLQSSYSDKLIEKFGSRQLDQNTVVLIEDGQVFTKSDVVILVASKLSGWPSLLQYIKIIPKPIRNFFYDVLAKYRYLLFGKQTSCMLPSKKNQDKFLA